MPHTRAQPSAIASQTSHSPRAQNLNLNLAAPAQLRDTRFKKFLCTWPICVLQGLFYGVNWFFQNQERLLKQVGLTPGLNGKTFIVQVRLGIVARFVQPLSLANRLISRNE